ncbi:MAG: MFS transporter [Chloroflexota bacterium]|nr:MAG: MFS transporter [Chloroflexota bacterium]
MHKSTNWIRLMTIGSFFAFFVFGFTDNMKGATLPAVLDDIGMSYAEGGSALFGAYVGFLIATLFTGMLADRAGKKIVLLIAGVCLAVGITGYSTLRFFLGLFGSMFVLGLGLGAIEIGCNALMVDLHADQKGRYLNMMSVFHGLGSTLAPLYAGAILTAGIAWQRVYQGSLITVFLMLLFFLLAPYIHTRAAGVGTTSFKDLRKAAFSGQMGWYYLLIALYVAAEIGIASWIVEFLQTSKGQTVSLSTQSLSLFFAMVMLGRFLGSFFVERVGYLRVMLMAALGSILSVTLGLFGPPALALALPFTGLFFSIIFPTITAAVSDLHQENTGSILGLLFTFAGVGGMLGPWLIGLFGAWLGIDAGFALVLVYCVLMSMVLAVLLHLSPRVVAARG